MGQTEALNLIQSAIRASVGAAQAHEAKARIDMTAELERRIGKLELQLAALRDDVEFFSKRRAA